MVGIKVIGIKDFDMPSCCNSCGHWSFNRDDEPLCDLTNEYIRQFDKRQEDCPLVEAISKTDYKNRLKADKVAMLMDLYLLFSDCQTVEECFAILNKQIVDLEGGL